MLIVLLIINVVLLIAVAGVAAFCIYAGIALYRIADKLEVTLPYMNRYKQKLEEEREHEESNERYNQMLEELSKKQIVGRSKIEPEEIYDELDSLEDFESSETEPESLMELLEFGLPDEELANLLDLASNNG